MMEYKRKWQCENCERIFTETELLKAKNPFDETTEIFGCPACKDVGGFIGICDEPNCTQTASCGFPTRYGYRRTCGEHMRAAAKNGEVTHV